MNKSQKVSDDWIPCPPGQLATLADHEHVRQRRQFLIRALSVVGIAVNVSAAGWLAFRVAGKRTEPTFGGIACSRVGEQAPQFMMGKLDHVVTQQIKTHLEQCVSCRTLFESMQPTMSVHSIYGGSS